MAHQKACLAGLLAMGFGNLAVEILDGMVARERPFVHEDLALLFYAPSDPSFPSNPAVVGTALSAGLWTADRRLGGLAFSVAAAWSLSRVYAGVAYPSDVLAGVALGIAIVAIVVWTFRRIEPAPTLVIRLAQRFHLA
jgi:membrane-associated phospholipid phosphatase